MSRDPGLQAERTAKAWERTAMVMAVDALLVLRAGAHADERGLLISGGTVAVAVCAIAGFAFHRRRTLRGVSRPIGGKTAVSLAAAAFGAALTGALSLGVLR